MYRRLKSNFGKVKDATFKAEVVMKKGMFVVKDFANKTVELPSAETSTGIFIVDFDPEYTGLLAVQPNVSDYDARMNDIAVGQKVTLEIIEVGEEYATDQFVAAGIAVGDSLAVGTAGKLIKAVSPATTNLKATNIAYNDAGKTLLAFTRIA